MKNLNRKISVVAIATFICCCVVAQPANDLCNTAQLITPNGSCVAGTTVAATDNWTGTVGCQTGNPNSHPDVWYSFVSTGNTYTATITGNGAWAGNVEFTLVSGTCAGGFTVVGSACGASPLNVTVPSITNGATYYFTISNSATGTPGPFQVCATTTLAAVPANDDCANAISLGTLPTPGACGAGVQNGAAVVVAGTNVNATPEVPYVVLNGCGMASPANSVWYRFVDPPSGYGLRITVSGGTLANPNIALWSGTTCGTLAGVNCIVGSGNAATLTISNGVIPGQTYYIQLSGNTGESGTYNLSVNAFQDCADCLNAASLTVSPLPVNGTYQPGQLVSFCFHIDRWTQTVNNWLHGVQLAFGPGWDMPTLTTAPPAAYVSTSTFWGAVNPVTCGNWSYYPGGTTSSATGAAWPAGFYFDGVYTTNIFGTVTGCGSLTGNPGNNFGDGVSNSGLVITPPANRWNFCWTIRVKPGCNPGMSLSMAVNTSGDGESGSWTSAGCSTDQPVNFTAQIACCPPTMASTGTCAGFNTGTATATPVGSAGPYTYSWSAGGQNTQTITGLAAGNYTVTITDVNLCSASASVSVPVAAPPTAAPNATPAAICNGASTTLAANAVAGSGVISTYAWSSGLVGNIAGGVVSPITNTTYTVTVTNSNSCTVTGTVSVTVNANPTVAPSVVPSVICSGGSTTLSANAIAGSGVITTYAWSSGLVGNVASGIVSPITNTTYTVTVTNSNTCTVTGTVSVTVNANPTVAPSVTPSAICNGASTTLAANATAGSGAITTYAWSSGLVGNVASGVVSPTTNTTYTVTVTNSNTCSATGTVSVVVNANPTLAPTATPSTICNGLNTTLAANAVAGSGAITTYAWSSGLVGNVAGGTVSPITNTTYTITVTNSNTCTATATVSVTVNPLPVPGASNTGPYCAGATVQLNSSGGNSYAWSGPNVYANATQNPSIANSTTAMSGTYTVTVTGANGCTATASTNVLVNALPVANAGADVIITCTVPLPSLSASPIGIGQSYTWSGPGIVSGGNTATPIVNANGTYTLVLTDANNCTASDNALVTSNLTLPNANAGPDGILNCLVNSVTLTASSSTAGVSFAWSNGINTANNSVSIANTYTVTVTDISNGCTASDNAVVTSNTTTPNANAGPDAILTCTVLSVTLTASSTTAGVNFAWSNGINTANNSVSVANTYTVTVTDPLNGCTASDNANVTSNITNPNANAGPDATLTCTVLSVTLNASSTTAGVSFAWSNGINVANNPVSIANTYTVTVTNPTNGCTASDAATVLSNTVIPNANAGADQTISCNNTSLQLNGSSTNAGVTFSWSGPGIVSGGNTATPTVNATGTYTLVVTDPVNGCTANDVSDVLPDTNIPNANAGPDVTLTCIINSVNLQASSTTAGVTFAWSNGINVANNSVNIANTYTVTVTDPGNGCTASDDVIVSSNTTLPNANAGPDVTLTCTILSVTLTASSTTAGVNFGWSNGINTAINAVNVANTYTVTVTDPLNGCTASDDVIVSSNTIIPNADAGPDATLNCIVASVTLNASSTTSGVSFAWSNGINFAANSVSVANTYTVTVTDPLNGCTASDAADVLSNTTIPNVNAGADQTLFCGVASLQLNGTSSTAGVLYSWSGAGILNGGNTATPNVNATGTFTLLVTDPVNGCTASDAVDILPDINAPNANAGPDATLTCLINSVTLTASSTTAGVSFAWSNGINTTTNSITSAGTYTVTVTDLGNGCTSSDQAIVTSNTTAPNANAGPDAILTCAVSSVTLTASSTTAGVNFIWSTGDVTLSIMVNAVNTYTVTVTDATNGCTASDQAVVTLNNTPPVADAGPDKIISCVTNGITLDGFSATTNAVYNWSGSGIVSGANTATPFVNLLGTYTLVVTDPLNGCTASDAANVVDPNAIVLTADVVDNPCVQLSTGQIDLHVNGGLFPFNYLWNTNAVTEDLSNLHGGTYSVTVTDNNGCTASDSYVLMEGTFSVDAQQSATINLGEMVQLTGTTTGGTGQESYLWIPDYNLSCQECTSPIASPYSDVVYILQATDVNGCTDYDSVKIQVIPIHDIFIPNVFTPNGDGNNDYFEVFGNKKTWKQFEVQVFNRWGEKVYESNDMNFKWDGIYKSKPSPASVYVYQIHLVYLDNFTDKIYKGSVTLVR